MKWGHVSTEAATSTRKAQAEETRGRILDVAINAFSTQRYDDVAVSDIATGAGAAHGLLFHYFKNKRGIYLAAMQRAAQELAASHEVDPSLSPAEQIRRMFRGHFEYLAQHRGLALRLVLGGRGADPEAWGFFEEDRWRRIEWVGGLLGLDPQVPAVRMMLRVASGAVDEVVAYWTDHDQPFDVAALTEVLIDQLISALRGAAKIDPSLYVEAAIAMLREV